MIGKNTSRRPIAALWVLMMGLPLLLLGSHTAIGAAQRMMLPPQSFVIPPSGAKVARAFCLDVYNHTPPAGSLYTSVPTGLDAVQVTAAGRKMTLQEAIDNKIVRVTGTGDYSSLRFHSLVAGNPITVTVAKNSVVTPDKSYSETDIKESSALRLSGSRLTQEDIWRQRSVDTLHGLGLSPSDISKLPLSVVTKAHTIYVADQWAKRRAGEASGRRAFLVQRVEGLMDSGPPTYILITGSEAPRVYVGNSRLAALSADVQRLWDRDHNGVPARIGMFGDGDEIDFDAARLTIEGATGGVLPDAVGGAAAGFSFEPPEEPPPGIGDELYDGKPWGDLRIARDRDGRYRSSQSFYDRGHIDVVARTLTVWSSLTAMVRGIIRAPRAKTAPRSEVISVLKEYLQAQLDDVYQDEPALKQQEGKGPRVEARIDGKLDTRFFVTVLHHGAGRYALDVERNHGNIEEVE